MRPILARDHNHAQKGRGYGHVTHLNFSALKYLQNRARELYKNISMLFLFPVKDGMPKLSTGVNATFNASCYG